MPAARGRHPKPAHLGGARSYYRPERWARERLIHTRRAGAGHWHPVCQTRRRRLPLRLGWTFWAPPVPSGPRESEGEAVAWIVTRRAETPLGGSGRPRLRLSRARSPQGARPDLYARGRCSGVGGGQPARSLPALFARFSVLAAVPDTRDALDGIPAEAEGTPAAAVRAKMLEGLPRLYADDAPATLVGQIHGYIGQRPVRRSVLIQGRSSFFSKSNSPSREK